jgi:hypothetical protein
MAEPSDISMAMTVQELQTPPSAVGTHTPERSVTVRSTPTMAEPSTSDQRQPELQTPSNAVSNQPELNYTPAEQSNPITETPEGIDEEDRKSHR